MSPNLKLAAAAVFALALQGCSNEREGETAEDFAARVGSSDDAPTAVATVPVQAAPPDGVDVLELEQLGNIAGVDLGPREGGCTFNAGLIELLLAGAPNDPASRGKAVVRAGGSLYLLDAAPGGMPAIRAGTRFTGQGITIDISAAGQSSRLTVTDGTGRSKTVPGNWVCA